jgi:PAS domain-containing protein
MLTGRLLVRTQFINGLFLYRMEKDFSVENKSVNELASLFTRFRRIINEIQDGVQIFDFNFHYLFANEAAIQQSKLPAGTEVAGKCLLEIFPAFEQTDLYLQLYNCMHQRKAAHIETKFIFPDQSYSYFKLSVQPIPEGIFIYSTDVSDKTQEEKKRIDYTDALESLLFITSHQVRQPVAHILGLKNVLEFAETKEEVQKIVDLMCNSISQLDQFTHELSLSLHELKIKNLSL